MNKPTVYCNIDEKDAKHISEFIVARGSGKSRLSMAGMLSITYNIPLEDMLKTLFEVENEIRKENESNNKE